MMKREPASVRTIVFLVASASILQIAESLIPHPVPGVRLGLANMITLVALVRLGFHAAVEITVFRTLVSSFILGTFLSPGFFLSFGGGLASTAVMGAVYRLSSGRKRVYLSLIGVSLLGAFTHNLVQIGLVYLLLIRHASVLLFLPWLGMSAVVTGWLTGLVASRVCRNLQERAAFAPEHRLSPGERSFRQLHFVPGESPVHRLRPEAKILFVLALAASVLLFGNGFIHAGIFSLLLIVLTVARLPLNGIIRKIRRLWPVLLFSFFMPLLFQKSGTLLMHAGPLQIWRDGLMMGVRFAGRIVILMTSALLLVQTTSPEALAGGLRRLLSPLPGSKRFGERASDILMQSWDAVPDLWDRLRGHVRERGTGKRRLRSIVSGWSDIIAQLFIENDDSWIHSSVTNEGRK